MTEGIFAHLQQLLPQRLPPPQQHRMRRMGSMSQRQPIPFPLQQESRSSKRMMLSHPQPPLPKKPFMICTSFQTRIAPTSPYARRAFFVTYLPFRACVGAVQADDELFSHVGDGSLPHRNSYGILAGTPKKRHNTPSKSAWHIFPPSPGGGAKSAPSPR